MAGMPDPAAAAVGSSPADVVVVALDSCPGAIVVVVGTGPGAIARARDFVVVGAGPGAMTRFAVLLPGLAVVDLTGAMAGAIAVVELRAVDALSAEDSAADALGVDAFDAMVV